MRQLIDFLFQNPLILILVGTWVLGLIGKALTGAGQRAAKTAQELREQQRRRMQQQVEEQKQEAAEVAKVEPQPRQRRLTQEEAMAEMRRILQGEPRSGDATPVAAQARESQEEQRQQKRHREAVAAEEQRQKKREVFAAEGSRTADRKMGQVEIHVDSHIGEAMQQRRTPASGQVGHSAMGGLGGRTLAHAAAISREQRGPVDLQDIKRLLIMREVLGPPLALRQDWGSGQPG